MNLSVFGLILCKHGKERCQRESYARKESAGILVAYDDWNDSNHGE